MEEHLEIYGRLREQSGIKMCSYGPMDYVRENVESAISCRRPGLAREKNGVYTSSQEEEKAQMCTCGKLKESSRRDGMGWKR